MFPQWRIQNGIRVSRRVSSDMSFLWWMAGKPFDRVVVYLFSCSLDCSSCSPTHHPILGWVHFCWVFAHLRSQQGTDQWFSDSLRPTFTPGILFRAEVTHEKVYWSSFPHSLGGQVRGFLCLMVFHRFPWEAKIFFRSFKATLWSALLRFEIGRTKKSARRISYR